MIYGASPLWEAEVVPRSSTGGRSAAAPPSSASTPPTVPLAVAHRPKHTTRFSEDADVRVGSASTTGGTPLMGFAGPSSLTQSEVQTSMQSSCTKMVPVTIAQHNQGMRCLALSPDRSCVVYGGTTVVALALEAFSCDSRRMKFGLSKLGDLGGKDNRKVEEIKWCPTNPDRVATAHLTGSVMVHDRIIRRREKDGRVVIGQIGKADGHIMKVLNGPDGPLSTVQGWLKTAGQHVAWHYSHQYLAVTNASRVLILDGTHDRFNIVCDYSSSAAELGNIKDVAFSPYDESMAMITADRGTYLFDLRVNGRFIPLTMDSGNALEFHPQYRNIVAIANRRKKAGFISVLDWVKNGSTAMGKTSTDYATRSTGLAVVANSDITRSRSSSHKIFECIAPPAKVRWRPPTGDANDRDGIFATIAHDTDADITIWDAGHEYGPICAVKRPYAHPSQVKDFQWLSHEEILSCTDNHTLISEVQHDTWQHHSLLPSATISFMPVGSAVCTVRDKPSHRIAGAGFPSSAHSASAATSPAFGPTDGTDSLASSSRQGASSVGRGGSSMGEVPPPITRRQDSKKPGLLNRIVTRIKGEPKRGTPTSSPNNDFDAHHHDPANVSPGSTQAEGYGSGPQFPANFGGFSPQGPGRVANVVDKEVSEIGIKLKEKTQAKLEILPIVEHPEMPFDPQDITDEVVIFHRLAKEFDIGFQEPEPPKVTRPEDRRRLKLLDAITETSTGRSSQSSRGESGDSNNPLEVDVRRIGPEQREHISAHKAVWHSPSEAMADACLKNADACHAIGRLRLQQAALFHSLAELCFCCDNCDLDSTILQSIMLALEHGSEIGDPQFCTTLYLLARKWIRSVRAAQPQQPAERMPQGTRSAAGVTHLEESSGVDPRSLSHTAEGIPVSPITLQSSKFAKFDASPAQAEATVAPGSSASSDSPSLPPSAMRLRGEPAIPEVVALETREWELRAMEWISLYSIQLQTENLHSVMQELRLSVPHLGNMPRESFLESYLRYREVKPLRLHCGRCDEPVVPLVQGANKIRTGTEAVKRPPRKAPTPNIDSLFSTGPQPPTVLSPFSCRTVMDGVACGEKQTLCAMCDGPLMPGEQYLWIRSCGHGGHTRHVLQWFSEGNEECPACGIEAVQGNTKDFIQEANAVLAG